MLSITFSYLQSRLNLLLFFLALEPYSVIGGVMSDHNIWYRAGGRYFEENPDREPEWVKDDQFCARNQRLPKRDRYVHTVCLRDGQYLYDFIAIDGTGGCAVVPARYLSVNGHWEVGLREQYRPQSRLSPEQHAANFNAGKLDFSQLGQFGFETAGGFIETGESSEDAARSELAEEFGFACESMIRLGETCPHHSIFAYKIPIFLALDLHEVNTNEGQEEIFQGGVVWVSEEEAYNLQMDGRMYSAITCTTVSRAFNYLRFSHHR